MPELPEVETTGRGIAPWVEGVRVQSVVVRHAGLRWPIPAALAQRLQGQLVERVTRRGKYLLLQAGEGHVLVHLGMSGSLRIVEPGAEVKKHDHVDFVLDNGKVLRFHDPRRFGCILWLDGDPMLHPLLATLGPEPLSEAFNADGLFALSRKRTAPVKQFIMDSHVVVGVGNIYANEALFMAGILPTRKAGTISKARYAKLVATIKAVLANAIKSGGTTLRDFVGGDGKPGYFKQQLHVYGRGGEPCTQCGGLLTEIRQGQRTTVYCHKCQT
jgi:formamidopyrimidine-DNA glycosylase